MKRFLWAPLFLLLSSCFHMSQQQCLNTNWREVGFLDGASGKLPQDLSHADADCSQYGIRVPVNVYQSGFNAGAKQFCTPTYAQGVIDGQAGKGAGEMDGRLGFCQQVHLNLNLGAYEQGRQKGLTSFCTYENGNLYGREGNALPEVCPKYLQARFNAGWVNGQGQFCSQAENGFALGKANKPYPLTCNPNIYYAFKTEYDRGLTITHRLGDVQNRLNDLNARINEKVNRYSFFQNGNQYYRLGPDRSDRARHELDEVNAMVRQKQPLDNELFNLQVMK